MVSVLWGAIAAGLGLAWLTFEAILGSGEGGASIGTTVLWLIIDPIVAVGAMVQQKRTFAHYPYSKAFLTGFITALVAALGLLGVWLVYVLFLNTDFYSDMLNVVASEAQNAGDTEQVVGMRVSSASLMFSTPMFFVISFLIPLISGTVASGIAALGVKRKS